MTRKTSKSHTVVERLIEQRRQYTDWLEKLDAEAAGAAPSHVADRVREDYAARLDAVTEELREHEDGLRQALSESTARVEELVQERQARSDELAEARLRRQVGEFSDDRFEEIEERCKAVMGELTKEIATNERDIERLEEVLSLIQGKEEEEEEEVLPEPVEVPVAAAPTPPPPPPPAAPPPPPPPPPPPAPPAPPPPPSPAAPAAGAEGPAEEPRRAGVPSLRRRYPEVELGASVRVHVGRALRAPAAQGRRAAAGAEARPASTGPEGARTPPLGDGPGRRA
jgi:outer membrane biosynthesis protein TonB